MRAKPPLTAAALEKRKRMVEVWSQWRPLTLGRSVFSNEAGITKHPCHGREVVFGKRGAPFNSGRSRPEPANKGTTVNVWVAITSRGVLAFRVFEGAMNGASYRKILIHNLLPAARKRFGTRRSWRFQQDNAPYHREAHVRLLMQGPSWKKIHVLDWPPYSPDLNIIENFWPRLQGMVAALRPHSKEEIKNAVSLAITQMNKEERKIHYFRNLFNSFPTRCNEVKAAGGFSVDH